MVIQICQQRATTIKVDPLQFSFYIGGFMPGYFERKSIYIDEFTHERFEHKPISNYDTSNRDTSIGNACFYDASIASRRQGDGLEKFKKNKKMLQYTSEVRLL